MRIVCLGSGNVATHIAHAFSAAGAEIVQVWSRNLDHAKVLANDTGADAISDLQAVDGQADLYLIAVKDDAIEEVSESIGHVTGLVVHTSGATAMEALKNHQRFGVFYPLQTFSKSKPIDFIHVPLCLEANTDENMDLLRLAAMKLSPLIYEVDSEKRKILHLAAVFACNFVNHLYQLGQQVLEKNDLDFEMLSPLIMETALKVQDALPAEVQTGPAIRGDKKTMQKHEGLLKELPHLQEIYKNLSNSIKKTH